MATGIPRTGKQQDRDRGETAGSPIEIAYAGKRTEAEILKLPGAAFRVAWASGCDPSNRLYFADNRGVLSSLLSDRSVAGRVRLVYIDPPFATQSVFESRRLVTAYEDSLAGAAYLEFLRERLVLLRELLAADGSLYVHLDDKMVFHVKLVLDEIFGARNFRNCIVRKKCNPKNYTRKTYGNVIDYVLFYTKADKYVWNRPIEAWTDERAREYRYVDPATGRRFMKVPLHAPGVRRGETGRPWRGTPPPPGKHWQYPPRVLDELDAHGEIFWSANGNPRRKVYLDESAGVPVQDLWPDFRDAHNQNIRITGYPTEKNPGLLRRIIEASSQRGDLVVDCFCGSGTTLEVAARTGRCWIGVDDSAEAIRTTLRRFAEGTEPMGDFVGNHVGNHGGQGNGARQAAFAFTQAPDASVMQPRPCDPPIEDFSLLAEEARFDEARALAADWCARCSGGASPRAPERSKGHSASAATGPAR